MPPTSTRGWRTWRRTKTSLGSFFKLALETVSAQTGPPGHRLQRRQARAPALGVAVARPTAERRAATRATIRLREIALQAWPSPGAARSPAYRSWYSPRRWRGARAGAHAR